MVRSDERCPGCPWLLAEIADHETRRDGADRPLASRWLHHSVPRDDVDVLSDGAGSPLGTSFPIPGDNTDPDGLLTILKGIEAGEPWAERATTCDVLVLKSCFPNNKIRSDAAATSLKRVYQEMR